MVTLCRVQLKRSVKGVVNVCISFVLVLISEESCLFVQQISLGGEGEKKTKARSKSIDQSVRRKRSVTVRQRAFPGQAQPKDMKIKRKMQRRKKWV